MEQFRHNNVFAGAGKGSEAFGGKLRAEAR
jgi:hypothetical protein